MIVMTAGCTAILEGEKIKESLHSAAPYEKPPEIRIEVSDYYELKAAILSFVMDHENSGEIAVNSYDGEDVQTDVDRACGEIMNDDPIGAYAVSDITGLATKILSSYEVDVSIEYKRTKQQMEYVNVSTERALGTELLSVMSDYLDEAVFRTTLNISGDDIVRFVREIYYQNPKIIVILPITTVEVFPPGGADRIFELHFGNTDRPDILMSYRSSLGMSLRLITLAADGENDAEILISLAENLMAACVYDEGMAKSISEHGTQNFSATAYGALVKASAVGEGFAMAYKALCDELGFDCQIVLGYLDGMVHAWNIVTLFGHNYHIDVAMCAVNGMETAFLKSDADFIGHYAWDSLNTLKCNGPLTYEDFVSVEPPEGTEEQPGEATGEEGGQGAGEPGEGTGEEPGGEPGEGNGEAPPEAADRPDEEPQDVPGDTEGEYEGLFEELGVRN